MYGKFIFKNIAWIIPQPLIPLLKRWVKKFESNINSYRSYKSIISYPETGCHCYLVNPEFGVIFPHITPVIEQNCPDRVKEASLGEGPPSEFKASFDQEIPSVLRVFKYTVSLGTPAPEAGAAGA